jgi:hypothetical protein
MNNAARRGFDEGHQQRGESANREGKNMRETRTRLFNFFVVAVILAAVLSVAPAAQDKGKEGQKPATNTVEAWRQALPPQAETDGTPEASAALPRRSRAPPVR